MASDQRSQLSDLYSGKNRPSTNCSCVYLVSADFVNDWKAFIRCACFFRVNVFASFLFQLFSVVNAVDVVHLTITVEKSCRQYETSMLCWC